MAGLFFWRKKREPQAIAGDEASSYDASQESVAETTTGVDELEVLTAPAASTPEKPKEKKPKFFKPKAKPVVEPEQDPEPEQEPLVEQVDEPVAEPFDEPVAEPIIEIVVPAEKPKVDLEPEPEPEPEVGAVDSPVAVPAIAPAAEVELEQVELPKRSFAKGIKALFTRIKFDLENLDELEDTLIQSDFGVDASAQIVESVKQRAKKQGAKTEAELKQILVDVIAESLEREDKQLNLADGKLPYVILVVGVNGVGKTTTIGKLANWLNEGQWRVVIGAADTFRAAAVEQIATWAERANAQLIRPESEGQDPASVAFKTVELALKNDADVAIIDTAGRLQNKKDLMAELDKIRRVVEKQAQISETLLVLDATTGQNGLVQAKAFAEVANVTGIVLTKLDGTAKGGIVYSIQRELGIPVKLVGVGEGIADFAFFDAREFAKGLVG
jgi:fused signal recognition particle receptor